MSESAMKRLQRELPEGVDAAIIESDVNRRYYTQMRSSAGTLFVARDYAALIIDFRYIEKARACAKDCEVILQDRLYEQLGALIKAHGVKTAAVEGSYMTVARLKALESKLPDIAFDCVSLDDVIFSHRAIKQPWELDCMREAQKIADKAFIELLNFIKRGRTEIEVAAQLEYLMRKFGGEKPSFDTISVSGKNSSMPHGVPTEKALEEGDFLTLDFGTQKNGYCSDTTRTVAIGQVSEEQRQVYDIVLQAQQKAFEVIRAGQKCSDIDFAARDFIENQKGYKGCFGHGLGHSLGLEIHEEPRFSPLYEREAKAGNVMSVEPGIYLEEKFGVRIEDVVIVGENGFENITKCPKELIIL